MIRFTIRTDDAVHVIHGNAPTPIVTFQSIDAEVPELEAMLREKLTDYRVRHFIGIELLSSSPTEKQS